MKLKSEKIKKFLSSLNDLDFRYLRLQVQMANDARNLIKEFQLSKEDFCKRMGLYDFEYDLFIHGGYNYSIETMAKIQAYYSELALFRDKENIKQELKEKFTDIKK